MPQTADFKKLSFCSRGDLNTYGENGNGTKSMSVLTILEKTKQQV